MAGLIASVAVLLVLIAVGASVTSVYLLATLKESEANRGRAEEAERDGQEKLWRSYFAQAQARRLSREVGQRFASLDALTNAARIARSLDRGEDAMLELRNEAIACLALPDLRFERRLGARTMGEASLAFDAAFAHYAWCDEPGNIYVRRLADDRALAHLLIPGIRVRQVYFEFSPTGKYLWAWHGSGKQAPPLVVWEWRREQPILKRPAEETIEAHSFSPDDRLLAVGQRDGSVAVYDLASGKEIKRPSPRVEPHTGSRSILAGEGSRLSPLPGKRWTCTISRRASA